MKPFQPINGTHDPAATIRPIEPRDDMPVALILSEGCREFGAVGAGFGVNECHELPLSRTYAAPRSAYFVMEREGLIAGGIGIAPLPCEFAHIAELQRFILLPMSARRSHGRRLLDHCLDTADRFGFRICYLESSATEIAMTELLELAGFQRIGKSLSDRPLNGANTYYFLSLVTP